MTDTEILDFLSKHTTKIEVNSSRGYKEILSCPDGVVGLRRYILDRVSDIDQLSLTIGTKKALETQAVSAPPPKRIYPRLEEFDTAPYKDRLSGSSERVEGIWNALTAAYNELDAVCQKTGIRPDPHSHWGYKVTGLMEHVIFLEGEYSLAVGELTEKFARVSKMNRKFNNLDKMMKEAHVLLTQDLVVVPENFTLKPAPPRQTVVDKIKGWFK
ncbi:hypothetical protein KASHIRA_01840 [Serratia phage vB_SmaM-Kashira]|nr:hypothetical protein KASHIRA_01840 [Serratia phage vB_SmaM-Kashira]